MQITIQLIGLGVVQDQINVRLQNFSGKISEVIQGAAIDCQADAKSTCPVDTGRLRASIQYNKTGDYSAEVGTNVSYAPYVEYGTHKMAPRPFLFPAAMRAKTNLLQEIQAIKV